MSKDINDKRILELKSQIEKKKETLDLSLKFLPITNCSIELDETRYNIQTLGKDTLVSIMIRLNSYLLSAKDLGLECEFNISGYSLEDWITDIKSRLVIINNKEEERKLKIMEDKLSKLLSEDKKVELEIDEIEGLLK